MRQYFVVLLYFCTQEYHYMDKQEGIIIKTTGNEHTVRCLDKEYTCKLRGQFRIKGIKTTNPIAVGDHVMFIEDLQQPLTHGIITDICPRKNYIYRKSVNLSKITHIIASNIDHAFLVISITDPKTPLGFIDRFLVAAESFRIPTTIVFNKQDLYTADIQQEAMQLEAIYKPLNYNAIFTSTRTGYGMDKLKEAMQNKVSLFCGQSGVGKSSLVNYLEPQLHLRTGNISAYNEKGRHTTTFAQMHALNMGGYIIDTPGIKEFGLIEYQKEEVCHYFPEMMALLDQCRFANCTHTHEPDCAIKQAVENGTIALSRYNNYLAIVNSEDIDRKEWMIK